MLIMGFFTQHIQSEIDSTNTKQQRYITVCICRPDAIISKMLNLVLPRRVFLFFPELLAFFMRIQHK